MVPNVPTRRLWPGYDLVVEAGVTGDLLVCTGASASSQVAMPALHRLWSQRRQRARRLVLLHKRVPAGREERTGGGVLALTFGNIPASIAALSERVPQHWISGIAHRSPL